MATTKTATLSDVPQSPNELEDYVAALFQATGYFVEKNITEQDFTQILELDAVATKYDDDPVPSSVLAEAKSGDWGFPDLFKVVGWMRYLDIGKGAFFVSKEVAGKDPAAVREKVAPLGVGFVHLGDFSAAAGQFSDAGFGTVNDPLLLDIWRYAYWMERTLVQRLRHASKSDPSRVGLAAALEYHRLVNDGIFFVKDVRERLSQLYDAYKAHPKLSLGVAIETGGGTYNPEAVDPKNAIMSQAIFTGAHPTLQACFYLEHRARLAILKAAIDYVCQKEAGLLNDGPVIRGFNLTLDQLMISSLPETFQAGLAQLRQEPYFKRYALFWQVFLWGFGGFYLRDRRDEEFTWLAEQTGIPMEAIPSALAAFDILFPTPDGWMASPGPTQCVLVKMVPSPLRGLGAYQRLRRYGVKQYSELGYSDYTGKDLGGWNNNAVDLLT